ncbi:MAG: hypothetical protein R3C49_09880, partial [Planctomycetaceae bacterium]
SMAQFFEIMKQQDGNLPAGLSWISTHPDHDARIIAVREQVGTLAPQDYQPLDIDWTAVQEALNSED